MRKADPTRLTFQSCPENAINSAKMLPQDPYLALTKYYVLLTRGETLLANTNLTGLTDLEQERHLKLLAVARELIAQMKRDYPDIDFAILATELTYWDPELEKLYPDNTDWSVFPS